MAVSPIQTLITNTLSSAQVSIRAVTTNTNAGSATDTQSAQSSVSVSSAPAALNATASLQNSAVGLAQLSSVLEQAQSGTQNISGILSKLQSLATEAQSGGPPSALASLDGVFQDLLTQINQVAGSTSFGGTSLLGGAFSSSSGSGSSDESLSLPNLTTQGLFGATLPNVLTVENANSAGVAISGATSTVGNAGATISNALNEVGSASGNIQTALANNLASTSTLTDSDLTSGEASTALSFNADTLASAQTYNLPPTLLSLLQE